MLKAVSMLIVAMRAAYALAEQATALQISVPITADGASIVHSPSFSSFSFEPAFWVEFFGNASEPNKITFDLLSRMVERGGQPIIRPGGITMDSMIFSPNANDPVRTTNEAGGIYRTTVGPAFYQSWSNFPAGTKFISTLNFGNNSLDIARDMALASMTYQGDRVLYFELGNEPTNYPAERWKYSTAAYVQDWKQWTAQIDAAVNSTTAINAIKQTNQRWFASSATTDKSGLSVRPVDIIPAGIDSVHQVAQYSIHSYAFATCDPARAARATITNILNHTDLVRYADAEIYPSAKAAMDSGKPWIIGEFNSIACSGAPNVSDTFAQALWVVDTQLIYAVRNASAVYLHQGATLVFQSANQSNSAGENGTPGFSTYDFVYPRNSTKRGKSRALPSFVSLLFVTEALRGLNLRVRSLETPPGVDGDGFSGYSFYENNKLGKIAFINMKPYYQTSTEDYSVSINITEQAQLSNGKPFVKRMTAPSVNEGTTSNVKWAGQSFESGYPVGEIFIEEVSSDGIVKVRGSEAVLIFFNASAIYRV